MEGITKKLFFDEMATLYPEAMKIFNYWIDNYKKSVHWDHIFNAGAYDNWSALTTAPKFHDLPFELQFGIIAAFMASQEQMYRHMPCKQGTVMYRLENCFIKLEAKITSKKPVEELQEKDLKDIKRHGTANNV